MEQNSDSSLFLIRFAVFNFRASLLMLCYGGISEHMCGKYLINAKCKMQCMYCIHVFVVDLLPKRCMFSLGIPTKEAILWLACDSVFVSFRTKISFAARIGVPSAACTHTIARRWGWRGSCSRRGSRGRRRSRSRRGSRGRRRSRSGSRPRCGRARSRRPTSASASNGHPNHCPSIFMGQYVTMHHHRPTKIGGLESDGAR